MPTLLKFKDIAVTRSANRLIIANACIARELDLDPGEARQVLLRDGAGRELKPTLAPGMVRTVSLRDGAGREFADSGKKESDFAFIGLNRSGVPGIPFVLVALTAEVVAGSIFDSEHVKVSLELLDEVSTTRYFREYFIYPELAAIAVQTALVTPIIPDTYWSNRNVGQTALTNNYVFKNESCADGILPVAGMVPERAVEFYGRTDATDTQVRVHPADQAALNGNLLFGSDASGAGFFFLQEAPPSGERRDRERYDFRLTESGSVFSCCWGIHPAEVRPGIRFQGYRHVLAVYHDAAERDWLLKTYLKRRFPFDVQAHSSIMVNPWGNCGKYREAFGLPFLKEEIKAAAGLGATHYQLDDAWQAGRNLGEMLTKLRHITPEFWKVDASLNGTFQPLTVVAAEAGIELGLWIAPSSNCEYRDWEALAKIILDFYRNDGIRIFKIDAIAIRSYEAEDNLRKLLRRVREQSDGKVYFNLDTTAGQRPGYFHFLEYGNIFLENRYGFAGLGYHPEKTLRSLWKLSGYMRAQMLQIEVLCPDDLDAGFYRARGMSNPKAYPLEYWAAIAMFANPLLWMTPSTVKAADRAIIGRMMAVHRAHRGKIFAGEIFPIGSEPDGASLCGLQSHDACDGSGYVIVFREAAESAGSAAIGVNYLPERAVWRRICGQGEVAGGAGRLRVAIPEAPGYALYAYGKA